jgi:CRP-like cAMP-binding protein
MVKRRVSATNRPPPATRSSNLLLGALPAADYARIAPALTVVPLKLKEILYKPGERIRYVYFPGGGFCSMVAMLEDGGMVEVATIGREGMIGESAVLDGGPVNSTTMVQGEADTCYRMTADAFRREMDRRGPFYELLTRYTQALVGFIIQSTACNAVHSVEQRLARWLLMARDRMGRRLPAHAGVRRDDARGVPADGNHRRWHVAEGRSDYVSQGARHHHWPRKARSGVVRMLPRSDQAASCGDGRIEVTPRVTAPPLRLCGVVRDRRRSGQNQVGQWVDAMSARFCWNAATHSSTLAGGSELFGLRLRRSTCPTSNRS